MTDPDPLKKLWATQPEEPLIMSEAEIGARARAFDTKIGRRNAIEYAAAALVALLFGYYAATDANPIKQAGAVAVVCAALFVTWRLAVAASPAKPSEAARAWYDHYRSELIRQRDALQTVWWWYALPFVPGLSLMIAAPHMHPTLQLGSPDAWSAMMWPFAFTGAVFGGIIWLNHVAAKKLQSQIDELDRASKG